MTNRQRETYHQWLLELTSLPTAAGCEQRVADWITAWATRRKCVALTSDKFGNLVLQRKSAGTRRSRKPTPRPIYITAHTDHPAFVVCEQLDDKQLSAEFRGGVRDDYFVGSKVRLYTGDSARPKQGTIISLDQPDGGEDKRATVQFKSKINAQPGDILTWNIPRSRISRDRLRAPVCDDLAALAAALAAFDMLNKRSIVPDVRLLFTRCEEVGFIGAIGACKRKTIPRDAIVITLENSKSFPESPIGGGPIIRVGDRISTFNHAINHRISQIATELTKGKTGFQFQRKLMTGGACEATAFQNYGYDATCLCLPLGNYHNMNETTGRIDAETISISDFNHLVQLLVEVGLKYHQTDAATPPLRDRLDKLFKKRKALISG